jgi:hypothetical protein
MASMHSNPPLLHNQLPFPPFPPPFAQAPFPGMMPPPFVPILIPPQNFPSPNYRYPGF